MRGSLDVVALGASMLTYAVLFSVFLAQFGTPEWMAPEVMEGNVYTEKIDVYSFGILVSFLPAEQRSMHRAATVMWADC